MSAAKWYLNGAWEGVPIANRHILAKQIYSFLVGGTYSGLDNGTPNQSVAFSTFCNAMLTYLRAKVSAGGAAHAYVQGLNSDTPITETYLGIDGIDASTVTGADRLWIWNVLRVAVDRLRYERFHGEAFSYLSEQHDFAISTGGGLVEEYFGTSAESYARVEELLESGPVSPYGPITPVGGGDIGGLGSSGVGGRRFFLGNPAYPTNGNAFTARALFDIGGHAAEYGWAEDRHWNVEGQKTCVLSLRSPEKCTKYSVVFSHDGDGPTSVPTNHSGINLSDGAIFVVDGNEDLTITAMDDPVRQCTGEDLNVIWNHIPGSYEFVAEAYVQNYFIPDKATVWIDNGSRYD